MLSSNSYHKRVIQNPLVVLNEEDGLEVRYEGSIHTKHMIVLTKYFSDRRYLERCSDDY